MILSSLFAVAVDEIAEGLLKIHSFDVKSIQQSSKAIGVTLGVWMALIIVFKWLRPDLTKTVLFRKNSRNMNGSVLVWSILFLFAAQFLFSTFFLGFNKILEIFGLSIEAQIQSAQGVNQVPLQLIYTLVLGPIAEELIFRGVIFQELRKYGQVFAMTASALFFGIYHGNLPQGIFAFAMGILFAYITAEYSIYWSIFLHIFNNSYIMWLNYGIDRLSWNFLGMIFDIISILSLLIMIGYFYKNHRQIKLYLEKYPTKEGAWRCLFESKAIVLFIILNIILAVSTMF
ncbi:MAG: lysostaphin resistance A-like protein [Lachnospiraceae bacterium]